MFNLYQAMQCCALSSVSATLRHSHQPHHQYPSPEKVCSPSIPVHVQAAAEHLKRQAATDWLPEYRPVSIVPPRAAAAQTYQKTTKISPAMILQVRRLLPVLPSRLANMWHSCCLWDLLAGMRSAHSIMCWCCVSMFVVWTNSLSVAAAAALAAVCLLQDVPASRKTKIVCTMGPSCTSAELLGKLVAAGMDLAHFDLTTGALEEQQAAYATLQQVHPSSGHHLQQKHQPQRG
jgi:hypothetical protein